MGRFLPQSLASLFAQDYPRLEVIVRDGGSTDETVPLLRSYGSRLRWTSAKDDGAADALRRGLAEAQGSILGWLNADDILEPWAIRRAVEVLEDTPGLAAVYGQGAWVDEHGAFIAQYPSLEFTPHALSFDCIICQPACFFRADAYRTAGAIDPSLVCSFDYDLWIRLSRQGPFRFLNEPFARSRMHRANKTLHERERVFQEGMLILQRHFGYVPYNWIHSYTCYRLDGRDQFFEPIAPSRYTHLRTLPAGLHWNWRRPVSFLREWLSHTAMAPYVGRLRPPKAPE
jgi:glycosyltransferase involved in cell wall biosynthesis